jgi:hypothetical protein
MASSFASIFRVLQFKSLTVRRRNKKPPDGTDGDNVSGGGAGEGEGTKKPSVQRSMSCNPKAGQEATMTMMTAKQRSIVRRVHSHDSVHHTQLVEDAQGHQVITEVKEEEVKGSRSSGD